MRSRSPKHRRRSRSRSRNRGRSKSRDRDFRPHKSRSRTPRSSSRSRSRSRSRGRSRSRSRSRGRHHSPGRWRHDGYDPRPCSPSSYEPHYPHGWGPGAGDVEPVPPRHWHAWNGGMVPGGQRLGERPPPWRDPGFRPDSPDRYPDGWQEDDWGRDRSRDRSRGRSSGLSRGSDTDRDCDWEREVEWARRVKGRETPTASIFVKGLPEDADESDLHHLFAAYPNISSVKVLRDRQTGVSRGMAFVDFATVDDARLLMESEQRWNLVAGNGQRLLLDYSHGAGSRGGGPVADTAAQSQDWICGMCSAVNFARRLECYHCYTARPANPRRVTSDLNEPSNILKVSGLEPATSEEALFQLLASVVPNIVDMRVIKDKYTGAPRGFAFVELASIAEAGKLMVACQGQVLPGQATPLKICYAKAKDHLLGSAAGQAEPGSSQGALPGADAAAAVAPANGPAAGPLGWKPKEFDASAVLDDGSSKQDNGSGMAQAGSSSATVMHAASTPGPAQGPAAATENTGQGASAAAAAGAGPGPGSEAATASAHAAAAAGVDAATIHAMSQAGFEFQASSGYWYDAKSKYFYDTKTCLYYHHSTNQWYQYDHGTGQYSAVGGDQQQQQQQEQQQQQQPPPQQQQQQRPAADKRRRAVIGSAPQYNPEGLLAAAALAKEREEEQKRAAAAKAARERQQQQQNKHEKKQPLMQGKPGIGALPGTGATAAASAAPATAAGQMVTDGSVQGVVYRSKWAQRAAQQQR